MRAHPGHRAVHTHTKTPNSRPAIAKNRRRPTPPPTRHTPPPKRLPARLVVSSASSLSSVRTWRRMEAIVSSTSAIVRITWSENSIRTTAAADGFTRGGKRTQEKKVKGKQGRKGRNVRLGTCQCRRCCHVSPRETKGKHSRETVRSALITFAAASSVRLSLFLLASAAGGSETCVYVCA